MLQYLVAGLVIGGIYAIASGGLIATYLSSGIVNFGFGAIAFFIARTYYFLETQHNWPLWGAAVVSILAIAPALGVILWFLLFRLLQQSSTLIKTVTTIGLSITIPHIANLLYGNPTIAYAPGLAPVPVSTFNVFGVAITLDQIIVALCVVVILGIGFVIVRTTLLGLRVRATVDSPAMTSLSGTNPKMIALGVWAATTFLCGLIGVLVGPLIGLSDESYTLLMAAAFTALLVGRLVHVGRTIIVALLLGLVSTLLEYWLPPTSPITGGIISGIPFAFMFIFLVYEMRRGNVVVGLSTGGMLDRAIEAPGGAHAMRRKTVTVELSLPDSARRILNGRSAVGISFVVVAAMLPLILSTYWVGLVADGICFAIAFLSFTLVTGEGGMIWLCQVSFAGVGAVMTAYLATTYHVPILLAILLAAIITVPGGLIIGFLTTRLGDLYVVLVTLAFGLLMDSLVFPLQVFVGASSDGISVSRPDFAASNIAFAYLALVAFCIAALVVEHLRRSTAGMGMTAARWSEPAARAVGLSVVQVKVLIAGLASFVAAFGGGLLAVSLQVSNPASFDTISGLVWLGVLVHAGVRSNVAALYAGLIFAIIPGVFQTYLPAKLSDVPPALFGLGAILIARNPDGLIAMHGRQWRYVIGRSRLRGLLPVSPLGGSSTAGASTLVTAGHVAATGYGPILGSVPSVASEPAMDQERACDYDGTVG